MVRLELGSDEDLQVWFDIINFFFLFFLGGVGASSMDMTLDWSSEPWLHEFTGYQRIFDCPLSTE